MRRAILLLVLAAAPVAGCGGGDGNDERAQVEDYVRDANAVQQRFAADFKTANDAYASFSKGDLAEREAPAELEHAETSIRSARADIAKLTVPAPARNLHGLLMHYFDLNVAMAHETAQLAGYQPAVADALKPLARVNRNLSRRLADATKPGQQAAALHAFASSIDAVVARLRALDAPPVVRPAHREQLRRLARTRDLAAQLRRALIDQDAERVARLLKRFRANATATSDRRKLAAAGVRRYNRRYEALTTAYQNIQREQGRLDQALP